MFAEEGENDAVPEEPHANPRGLPVPAQEKDGPGDRNLVPLSTSA